MGTEGVPAGRQAGDPVRREGARDGDGDERRHGCCVGRAERGVGAATQVRHQFSRGFKVTFYREYHVGPAEVDAVAVKLLAQKSARQRAHVFQLPVDDGAAPA